jgi:hypothetical protein
LLENRAGFRSRLFFSGFLKEPVFRAFFFVTTVLLAGLFLADISTEISQPSLLSYTTEPDSPEFTIIFSVNQVWMTELKRYVITLHVISPGSV